MSDISWALPASIALLAALLIAGGVVVVVRARRRSPRAAAVAAAARSAAEAALLRLDDDATELDVAFEAADALTGDDTPTDLRRSRAAVLRGRDRGFAEVAALATSTRLPAQRRVDAVRLRDDLERRIAATGDARDRLAAWARTHGSVTSRVVAARARRAEIARTSGDPARLVAEARSRFDETEWADADRADREARAALAHADAALDAADAVIDDPATADARVLEASIALRRAGRLLRAVEDAHRIVLQAAESNGGQIDTATALAAFDKLTRQIDQLNDQGILHIKNAQAQAHFDLVISSIRAQIATIEVLLGQNTSKNRKPRRHPYAPLFAAVFTPAEIEELIALAISAGSFLVPKLLKLRGQSDAEILAAASEDNKAAIAIAESDGAEKPDGAE
ncbi:MAG: hypothetical protein ABT07_01385 [Microbacterium sp. SCN 70-10]|nr:MAG: hypothetical protein ABT07_01385 [Microbacterium sp. SCN 70-10]